MPLPGAAGAVKKHGRKQEAGRLKLVKQLVSSAAAAAARDSSGAAGVAAMVNHLSLATTMRKPASGRAALHMAAQLGLIEALVKLLVMHGADPRCADDGTLPATELQQEPRCSRR